MMNGPEIPSLNLESVQHLRRPDRSRKLSRGALNASLKKGA